MIIIGLPPRNCLQTVQLSWEFDDGSVNRKKGDNAHDETKINVFTLQRIFKKKKKCTNPKTIKI